MSDENDYTLYVDPIMPPPPNKIGDLIKAGMDNGIQANQVAFSIYVAIVASGNNSINYDDILKMVKDESGKK